MITEGIILAAFPPHDGEPIFEHQQKSEIGTFGNHYLAHDQKPRAVLNNIWSRYSCWYKNQPIQAIRNYFGEKVLTIYIMLFKIYTCMLILILIKILLQFNYST